MTEPSKTGPMTDAAPLVDQDLDQVVGAAPATTTTTKEYFLKIDGIDGESQDDKHKG